MCNRLRNLRIGKYPPVDLQYVLVGDGDPTDNEYVG